MIFNQEEANRRKAVLQEEAYNQSQQHNDLLLLWATGVGKARAAGLCMQDKVTLIVHHQLVHKQNWIADLEKHGFSTDVVFCTYAGIDKEAGNNYDIVIFDECHHLTQRSIKYARQIATNRRLYLSATVPTEKMLLLKQLSPDLKMFRVGLAEAIRKGILPQPRIFVKRLKLDTTTTDLTYIKGAKGNPVEHTNFTSYWNSLRYQARKVQYHISCTQAQYYQLLTDEMEWWKSKYFTDNAKMFTESEGIANDSSRKFFVAEWYRQNEWVKNRWRQLGSQRKRFMGDCKAAHVASVLRQETSRCLVFASSIEQCDAMAGTHVSVHSKSKKDNTDLVRQFNEGEVNRLYAVSMLNEGMNLANLEKIFMVQLDGSKLMTIQKLGRSLRGEEPEIYCYVLSDTRDEDYLHDFLGELDDEFCTYLP